MFPPMAGGALDAKLDETSALVTSASLPGTGFPAPRRSHGRSSIGDLGDLMAC